MSAQLAALLVVAAILAVCAGSLAFSMWLAPRLGRLFDDRLLPLDPPDDKDRP